MSEFDSDFDVAIVGGGPAGSAAALTLLRYSKLRTVVIERSSYDGWRAGETLSPGVLPLLGYLGAEGVLSEGQRRAYATSAAWGSADVVSRDFLYTGGGDAWHLDRTRFDAALAGLVADRGGTLLTGATVGKVEPRWTLGVNDSTIQAKFVIDATGRHASFARTQGAHATADDHLTGLVAIFEGGDDSQAATLVEAVEDGWWYSAHLPSNRTVVAFMTDADVVRAGRLHDQEAWLERLGDTRPTRLRIVNAQLVHGPIACPAHSQMLDPVAGEGWLAAGEAAAGFDPLSSMGIGYAIASGIQSARVAASTLGGDTEHQQLFANDVRRHYQSYLAKRQAYYRMEKRWPESPFWARRQA
ncbi:MAG TPA: tryptophan 7-halogenase [Thermoanaerobaculia bacterium]|nr:tryptophan 7-halogenase [Thermoanaerobaculia bacterium]